VIDEDWVPHRREDGELLGWIRPEGEAWVPVSLLGRPLSGPSDWLEAEQALEAAGLAWLAEPWILEREPAPVVVTLAEVTPQRVVVQTGYAKAVGSQPERIVLPWPAPPQLRRPRPGDPQSGPTG